MLFTDAFICIKSFILARNIHHLGVSLSVILVLYYTLKNAENPVIGLF